MNAQDNIKNGLIEVSQPIGLNFLGAITGRMINQFFPSKPGSIPVSPIALTLGALLGAASVKDPRARQFFFGLFIYNSIILLFNKGSNLGTLDKIGNLLGIDFSQYKKLEKEKPETVYPIWINEDGLGCACQELPPAKIANENVLGYTSYDLGCACQELPPAKIANENVLGCTECDMYRLGLGATAKDLQDYGASQNLTNLLNPLDYDSIINNCKNTNLLTIASNKLAELKSTGQNVISANYVQPCTINFVIKSTEISTNTTAPTTPLPAGQYKDGYMKISRSCSPAGDNSTYVSFGLIEWHQIDGRFYDVVNRGSISSITFDIQNINGQVLYSFDVGSGEVANYLKKLSNIPGSIKIVCKVLRNGKLETIIEQFQCVKGQDDIVSVSANPTTTPPVNTTNPTAFFNVSTQKCNRTILLTNQSKDYVTLEWDMGNGDKPKGTLTSYTYMGSGNSFQITLTVTDANGKKSSYTSNVVLPTVPEKPQADFVANIKPNNTVEFINNTKNAFGYSWDFGDGTIGSNEKDPVHTYSANGTYTAKLSAINECGVSSVITKTITTEPGVKTNYCQNLIVLGLNPTIANWLSSVDCQTLANCPDVLNIIERFNCTYKLPPVGSTPYNGATMVNCEGILKYQNGQTKLRQILTASLIIPIGLTTEADTTFDTDAMNATSFSWNFGDGTTSNQTKPKHRYTKGGNFSVTVTITDGCTTKILTKVVSILQPTPPPPPPINMNLIDTFIIKPNETYCTPPPPPPPPSSPPPPSEEVKNIYYPPVNTPDPLTPSQGDVSFININQAVNCGIDCKPKCKLPKNKSKFKRYKI